MSIIKGTHSQPGQIRAIVSGPGADGVAEAIEFDPTLADVVLTSPFKYLTIDSNRQNFNALLPQSNNAEIGTVIQHLKALADAMIDEADTGPRNSRIPVVYTYWGQFIDHDITAGTDRAANSGFNLLSTDILEDFHPQPPLEVEQKIINLRLPQLDLDSVYGGGPNHPETINEGIFESDNVRLKLGTNTMDETIPPISSQRIPFPELDASLPPQRDLPRRDNREPRIGDARNDENTIVAQFHVAFLRFHNEVVKHLQANPALCQDAIFDDPDLFAVARQIVCWHYQWLVVNDYLETVAIKEVVREIVTSPDSFFANSSAFMPLEFSVSGFRFGHSMIRNAYDFNMNFGNGAGLPAGLQPLQPVATLNDLFEFTGKMGFLGFPTLPVNWIIDWDRATIIDRRFPARSAQKIDTNLAISLGSLLREKHDPLLINRHLARRNLLRSYLLNIPVAQHIADFLGVKPMTTELLPATKPLVRQALEKSGFHYKTPLWYYLLREAEVHTDGESLGELGTRLVAGTLIGMIKADHTSYLNKGWDPAHATAMRVGGNGEEIRKIGQFFQFAHVALVDEVPTLSPVA